ncbi:Dyp-type peroxidase [Corynebacterium propinquum]
MAGFSRRHFLAGLGTGASAIALQGCSSQAQLANNTARAGSESPSDAVAMADVRLQNAVVEFDGAYQAGIKEPQQARANLVAFNLKAGIDREGVRRLLKLWTEDARRLTAGIAPRGTLEPELLHVPGNLTITVGFGPGLFTTIDAEDHRPDWLQPIPEFSRDELDPHWGEADLLLQIASDEPLTATYALRHMIRSGVDYVDVAWLQQGFSHADGARSRSTTPRNLFGQFDGTVNPRSEEEFANQVFIPHDSSDPDWIHGGSAMVIRRIRMNLDTWEKLDRGSRENAMGRKLDSGAPLTGTDEHDDPDFTARDKFGLPVIDPTSHMARARNPDDKPEQKLLRRPFSYDLPPEPGDEQLSNSGLIFICYQQDPREQFIPIQTRLDEVDRLNEWITHIGSSVWAIPPGTDAEGQERDEYWGQSLLEA